MYKKLINYDMPDYWKVLHINSSKNASSDQSEQLLVNSTHKITRQELGRNSWQFLHMVSGNMPDKFDDELQAKTNLYLNLL